MLSAGEQSASRLRSCSQRPARLPVTPWWRWTPSSSFCTDPLVPT